MTTFYSFAGQLCEPPRVLASQYLFWSDRDTSDFSGVGGSYVNSCIKTRSTSAKNKTLQKSNASPLQMKY